MEKGVSPPLAAQRAPQHNDRKTRRPACHPKPKVRQRANDIQPAAPKAISAAPPAPTLQHFLTSVSTTRTQMRSAFCAHFVPASASYAYMHAIFEVGDAVRRASDSACVVAGDALCVLQLGTTFASRHLIAGYYELYGKAVQRLRVQVARLREGAEQSAEAVVAAAYFLALCESFVATRYDSRGFFEHMKGLMAMLEQDAWGLRSRLSGQAAACFEHWRFVQALGYGLVARKAVRAQRPVWDLTAGGESGSVTELALQVPGCLEGMESACRRIEKCTDDAGIVSEVDDVLEKALKLRHEMKDCMSEWARNSDKPPYEEVSIQEYPTLPAQLDDLAEVFPMALRFSDLPVAKVLRTYWVARLALDQAILETCRKLLDLPGEQDYTEAIDDHELADVRDEAGTVATLLARSLPYLCSSCWNTSGSYGVSLPLHFLEQYFEWAGRGNGQQLAWCRRLKESVVLGYKVKTILETGRSGTS